jgi:glycogen debranching enzyme
MFEWTKYNTQWLMQEAANLESIDGIGLTAGSPDYPWWFGTDNAYSIQGLLAAGMHEQALETIHLIMALSDKSNGNGRIIHEASTNGVVFNPGNLNTTPHFIYAIAQAVHWTGDTLLLDNYYDQMVAGLEWVERQDLDGNGFPDGAGMMEIPGLHTEMIDVVVYLQQAYEAMALMAGYQKDFERVREYESKANLLREVINSTWWVKEENAFADFMATGKEAFHLIKAAIERADTLEKPWAVAELKEKLKQIDQNETDLSGYVVHHNWVTNTPMEMGVAAPQLAQKGLQTAKKYRNQFGMFVTGIDRDESRSEKWSSFNYVGAVMTLPTGVQVRAEANYGNADASLEYLHRLANSFGYALPGSMYEVSPDYGMMAQAWNIYAVAVPIVTQYLGLRPRAVEQKIFIEPQLPSSWNDLTLNHVRVGANLLNLNISRDDGKITYKIQQSRPDWELVFKGKNLVVNGKPLDVNEVRLTGMEQVVEFTY